MDMINIKIKKIYLTNSSQNNKNEKNIFPGKIAKIINDYEFEYSLNSSNNKSFSSGFPICISDNLFIIGINKGENNHGIFLGSILDELENNDIQSFSENESLNEDNENNSSIAMPLNNLEDSNKDLDTTNYDDIEKSVDIGHNFNFVRHGYGIGYYANGTYEGMWENDKKHGKGKYTFKNGDIYIGEFKYNEISGKGIFYINHDENNIRRFEGILHLGNPENFDVYKSFLK